MNYELFKSQGEVEQKTSRVPKEGFGLRVQTESPVFQAKRLMISQFPCYGTQENLDIFSTYGIASSLRTFFVPCVDCDACFQKKMTQEAKCRYPDAEFYEKEHRNIGVIELGEPTSFVTAAGRRKA